MNIRFIALALLAAFSTPASAQLIDPIDKYAWGENVGFINWGNTPAPGTPFVDDGFLSGYIWGENIGWINLGDGNGPYANTDGTNFGVNFSGASNLLSGFAWGENVGWINFSGGALAAPRDPALIDFANNRFRGYVWGENIGWINLDDPNIYVGLLCPADFNQDGILDFFDIIAFVGAFDAQIPTTDLNMDGLFDFFDLLIYVGWFSAGCP